MAALRDTNKESNVQTKENNNKKARSNTVKTPAPKPKSKAETKERSNNKKNKTRQIKKENKKNTQHRGRNPKASPHNMTEEELIERSELQKQQLLEARRKANNKAKNKHELTQNEIKKRDECLDAKAQAIRPTAQEMRDLFAEEFERQCMTKQVKISGIFGTTSELTPRDLEQMFYDDESTLNYIPDKRFFVKALEQWIFKNNKDLKLHRTYRYDPKRNDTKRISLVIAEEILNDKHKVRKHKARLMSDMPFNRWLSCVAENPKYKFAREYRDVVMAVSDYKTRTYDTPQMKRHFILDIGPTNSGKTYSGMQELIAAESGVYLGPLRLLAMEAAETINDAGVLCSMVTGEEAHVIEDARHIASTVEMLNRDAYYDVAVIDECQMITDPERGYAWSAAIASIKADIIHLCLAPEAEELIINILDSTDEEYEIQYHERLVPLEMDTRIHYPYDIQPGDAIVVFSRKEVQAKAAELEKEGYKTSIVYGALPYEVRKEEVRKFAEGETDVVVATDAIGMGMNLPIQRVVFMEGEKYDGHHTRPLLTQEIKQIAGRAGRFGKYETGYVTSCHRDTHQTVAKALEEDAPSVKEIRLDIPYQIISLPFKLSQVMRAWQLEKLNYPYVKRELGPQISLARRIDDLPNDFVMQAIEIPFKSGDFYVPLDDMWEKAVRAAYAGKNANVPLYNVSEDDTLQRLEDAAKVADLAYGIAKRYGTEKDIEKVNKERNKINELMIECLKENKTHKKCSWCGKEMSSTSPHNMHDECYHEFRAAKYGYDMYW